MAGRWADLAAQPARVFLFGALPRNHAMSCMIVSTRGSDVDR
jgi:hypothetical protein